MSDTVFERRLTCLLYYCRSLDGVTYNAVVVGWKEASTVEPFAEFCRLRLTSVQYSCRSIFFFVFVRFTCTFILIIIITLTYLLFLIIIIIIISPVLITYSFTFFFHITGTLQETGEYNILFSFHNWA